MATEPTRVEFGELEQLRQDIDQWRRDRPQFGVMPTLLWERATAVARKLGVYQTSKTLRVNYAALKQRVFPRRGTPRPSDGARPVRGRTQFVELSRTASLPPPSKEATVVEVVTSDGARLIIRLAESGMNLATLVSAFRDRR